MFRPAEKALLTLLTADPGLLSVMTRITSLPGRLDQEAPSGHREGAVNTATWINIRVLNVNTLRTHGTCDLRRA